MINIDEIAEIDRLSFSEPWVKQFFLKSSEDENYLFFIEKECGNIAGFVMVLKLAGDCEIVRIAVLPEYRRKGIAEKLVEKVAKYGSGENMENIFLEVRAGNSSARALYLKCGFEECGVRKGYYNNPKEDGVVMRKRLI